MAISTSERESQRYIGDGRVRIVHDALHEDPTPHGCNIGGLLRASAAVRFEPDRLRQAQSEGYTLCERCFYRLEDRPSQTIKRVI